MLVYFGEKSKFVLANFKRQQTKLFKHQVQMEPTWNEKANGIKLKKKTSGLILGQFISKKPSFSKIFRLSISSMAIRSPMLTSLA